MCALNDDVGAKYLHESLTIEDYGVRVKHLYNRLSILIRDLDQGELKVIYNVNQPSFYASLDSDEKTDLKNTFDPAYANTEQYMMGSFKVHAKEWIASPAGRLYKESFDKKK